MIIGLQTMSVAERRNGDLKRKMASWGPHNDSSSTRGGRLDAYVSPRARLGWQQLIARAVAAAISKATTPRRERRF